MEDSFQKGFTVVKAFRHRAKLMADFRGYQVEQGMKPLVLVKARMERLGSKFAMTRRLLKLKKVLKPYAHKKRFKLNFAKNAKDRDLKHKVASVLKDKEFWRRQRLTAKVICPIIKSMRMCDRRLQGKAGLLYPSLIQMQDSVIKRMERASPKVVSASASDDIVSSLKAKLTARIQELSTDKVKAACVVHPYNRLQIRREVPMHVCTAIIGHTQGS